MDAKRREAIIKLVQDHTAWVRTATLDELREERRREEEYWERGGGFGETRSRRRKVVSNSLKERG